MSQVKEIICKILSISAVLVAVLVLGQEGDHQPVHVDKHIITLIMIAGYISDNFSLLNCIN